MFKNCIPYSISTGNNDYPELSFIQINGNNVSFLVAVELVYCLQTTTVIQLKLFTVSSLYVR